MKIKLSQKQWENIGKKAGWLKNGLPSVKEGNKVSISIPFQKEETKDPEDERYCSVCGAKDPEYKIIDEGIGPYEFWGSRGNDVRLTTGTACCGAGIVDGLGKVRELPDVDTLRSRFERD